MNGYRVDSKTLKFNIVCTPGSAQYVTLFALSLLKWSDCSFRLVANGCPSAEMGLLQKFCQNNPRLGYVTLPFKTMVEHGQALTYLQSQERSDTFCFMDSDILATGEFLSELIPYLGQYAGVFSGSPVWLKDEEKILPATFQRMAGRYNRTDEGLCIGSSYFAIYDNRVLTQVIQSTGIGLNRYKWTDVSVEYQNQLAQMGLKKTVYDTGKLLNLLLLRRGEHLLCKESPALQHVGGISTVADIYSSLASRVRVFCSQLFVFKPLVVLMSRRLGRGLSSSELLEMQKKREDKIKTCRYIGQLLFALFKERPLPTIPGLGDPQIRERIEWLTAHIVDLYKEFQGQL